MPVKVTKIRCPCCDERAVNTLGFGCLWCGGTKRLPANTAKRYAELMIALGDGGYICGDHDWKDRCEMLKKADQICKLLRIPKLAPELRRG